VTLATVIAAAKISFDTFAMFCFSAMLIAAKKIAPLSSNHASLSHNHKEQSTYAFVAVNQRLGGNAYVYFEDDRNDKRPRKCSPKMRRGGSRRILLDCPS
jgi:hypothetical protein